MPVPTHTSAQAGETHFPERGRKRTSLAVTLTAGLVALTLVACSNGEPTAEETVDVYQIAQERANAEASASASASAAGIDLEEANAQASQEARANALPSLSPELAAQREQAWDTPAPEIPDEIYENDGDGAITTAVTFLTGYRYAFMTGDTTLVENLSEDGCQFCSSTIERATELHESGGWCDYWEITINNAAFWELQEGAEYNHIELAITVEPTTTNYGDGSDPQSSNSEELVMYFAMRYSDGQWRVGGAEFADE